MIFPRRVLLALAVWASLAAATSVIDTPPELLHHRGWGWYLLMLGSVYLLAHLRYAGAWVVIGAGLANATDAALDGVEDPFTMVLGGYWVAFNAADVTIVCGLVLTIGEIIRHHRHMIAADRREAA